MKSFVVIIAVLCLLGAVGVLRGQTGLDGLTVERALRDAGYDRGSFMISHVSAVSFDRFVAVCWTDNPANPPKLVLVDHNHGPVEVHLWGSSKNWLSTLSRPTKPIFSAGAVGDELRYLAKLTDAIADKNARFGFRWDHAAFVGATDMASGTLFVWSDVNKSGRFSPALGQSGVCHLDASLTELESAAVQYSAPSLEVVAIGKRAHVAIMGGQATVISAAPWDQFADLLRLNSGGSIAIADLRSRGEYLRTISVITTATPLQDDQIARGIAFLPDDSSIDSDFGQDPYLWLFKD